MSLKVGSVEFRLARGFTFLSFSECVVLDILKFLTGYPSIFQVHVM
jgi:hypothetical protein